MSNNTNVETLSQVENVSNAMTPKVKADVFSSTLDTNVRDMMLCIRAISTAMAAQELRSYESRLSKTRGFYAAAQSSTWDR